MFSAGCRSHKTVRSPVRASTRITAIWLVAPAIVSDAEMSTPSRRRLSRETCPNSSSPNRPIYLARHPRRAQVEAALGAAARPVVSVVLVAGSGAEVAEHLQGLTPERSQAIGRAAYERVRAEHTYAHRARQVEAVLEGRLEEVGA